MDIIGAKALKDRLGPQGVDVPPPAAVEVPEEAPPVYRWVGVSWPGNSVPLEVVEADESATAA